MTVAAILKHKHLQAGSAHGGDARPAGPDVAAVSPGDTIADVAKLLASRRIGAVLVQDTAHHLLGILSERDIIRGLSLHGTATLEMTAAQLMTTNITTATPRTTVTQAMEIMTAGRFRHLPIMDDNRLVGIVSIGDVVNARLRDQAHEVDSLKAYVAG